MNTIIKFVQYGLSWGFTLGGILGFIYYFILFPFTISIFAIFFILLGSLVGTVIGFLNGLILGLITSIPILSQDSESKYRLILFIAATLTTLFASFPIIYSIMNIYAVKKIH